MLWVYGGRGMGFRSSADDALIKTRPYAYTPGQETQPGGRDFLIGEGPALPGLVHRRSSITPFGVCLRGYRRDHRLKARGSMEKEETTEHVGYVQQVVPDKGVFRLAKIAAHAKVGFIR
jgi:hypothetical protein